MNRWIKGITMVLVAALCCVGLVACDGQATLQTIVSKAYDVTVSIEKYVQTTDSTNLASQVSSLQGPLKITASSIRYVAGKVSDASISATLSNVADSVDTIVVLVQTADPTKIEEIRQQILSGVAKTKESLVLVGSYLDLDLRSMTPRASVTINTINEAAQELYGLVKVAK